MRLDRSAFSVSTVAAQQDDEVQFWRAQPPEARWQALEMTRRAFYGPLATARLQRVLEIARRP